MAKVSVLVAVYNAAAYLHQCLDSLLIQTLSDIQVVCVDDASNDNSASILDSYAQLDSRVEVYHLTQNVGIAKARNIALQHAKGTYTCMLDSDDWYSEDAFEKAVNVFEQSELTDCVLFRFLKVYEYEGQQSISKDEYHKFSIISGEQACLMSLTWEIHGIYMVRTEIHKRFPYDDTCKLYSDENTTRLHYAVAREVRSCEGVYYYRQHQQSETHRLSARRFDRLRAKESLMEQLVAIGVTFDVRRILTNQIWLDVVDLFMFLFVHSDGLQEEDRRYGCSELHRMWLAIDRSLLDHEVVSKFGYRPMRYWWAFRVQEWLYFTLRGLLGKNY